MDTQYAHYRLSVPTETPIKILLLLLHTFASYLFLESVCRTHLP